MSISKVEIVIIGFAIFCIGFALGYSRKVDESIDRFMGLQENINIVDHKIDKHIQEPIAPQIIKDCIAYDNEPENVKLDWNNAEVRKEFREVYEKINQ
jgi:tetrahydromethanopterin S-methyltransferase subunit A